MIDRIPQPKPSELTRPSQLAERDLYLMDPYIGEAMLFELRPDERRAFIRGFLSSALVIVAIVILFISATS